MMIEHKSLVSRFFYMLNRYNLNSTDNVFFYRSFSFDGSIEEYLLPLISGTKCFIASSDFKENIIGNILYQLQYNNITKLNT